MPDEKNIQINGEIKGNIKGKITGTAKREESNNISISLNVIEHENFVGRFKSNTFRALACIISILVLIVFVVTLFIFKANQRKIIENYDRKISLIKKTANSNKYVKFDTIYDIKYDIEKINIETRSLLELEFNRIQQEYTILSIWAGVLTIVFLIFSFYSLFKSDEMVKQARDGLSKIDDLKKESDDTVRESNSQLKNVKEKLNESESSINEFDDTIKNFTNDIEKLKRLEKQFSGDLSSAIKGIQSEVEDGLLRIQNAISDYYNNIADENNIKGDKDKKNKK